MKNLIFIIVAIITLLISCKKDPKITELDETTRWLNALGMCVKEKNLPNVPKQDTYVEGEIDGDYFSISKTEHLGVQNTLRNFLASGYQKEYANKTTWQGNGVAIYPIDTFIVDKFNYFLEVNFQSFQGDSLAYFDYFNQFQKGKTFRFKKNWDISESSAPETVEFNMTLFGCSQDVTKGNVLTSKGVEQTNSYFRIVDIKNYISPSGQIFKRDVTIEFDVTIGSNFTAVKRIKNGRLFFSY